MPTGSPWPVATGRKWTVPVKSLGPPCCAGKLSACSKNRLMWDPPSSGAQERLDRPALVHGGIRIRHLRQRQLQVEDAPRRDVAGQHGGQQIRQIGSYRG